MRRGDLIILKKLKQKVFNANLSLVKHNLVLLTWGNVSAIDSNRGLIAIKPSGVSYEKMKFDDIVIVDLNGNVVESKLSPSSDTLTHIELYKAFSEIGAVVHTHSTYAVGWSQAGRSINCYGTTHADYFYGQIPCTRDLAESETATAYEKNIGLVIAETFKNLDAIKTPAVLVKNHGPFTWGKDADEALYHAIVLEEVAKMAYITETLNGKVPAQKYLIDKHYFRKHSKNAYYGQRNEKC